MRKISLIGKKFGRLTVLSDAGTKGGRTYSNCLCDCGKMVVVSNKHLKSGHTKSCGCYKNEIVSKIGKITGKTSIKYAQSQAHENNRKHDMSGTRLYRIWSQMKQRCYNKKDDAYQYYGGKGVCVCDEWREDFKKFEGKELYIVNGKVTDDGYLPCSYGAPRELNLEEYLKYRETIYHTDTLTVIIDIDIVY